MDSYPHPITHIHTQDDEVPSMYRGKMNHRLQRMKEREADDDVP